MLSLNRVYLIGNLGKDATIRYTQAGTPVVGFSLATTEYGGKDKEKKTEWHNVSVFGKLAEAHKDRLKKGVSVAVEGRLQSRSFDGKDGTKKYMTEVICNFVTVADGRSSSEDKTSGQSCAPDLADLDI